MSAVNSASESSKIDVSSITANAIRSGPLSRTTTLACSLSCSPAKPSTG
jgi:hypothetical protein